MNEIRRYSIGARGEKVFHEDGPHVSYADHVKALQEERQRWLDVACANPLADQAHVSNFWENLGGDRRKL